MLYNPDSGTFTRNGKPIGTKRSDGYIVVWHDGKLWLAHRLAWFIVHGVIPVQIDHANGDRADNRLCNFRAVTNRQNQEARHTVVGTSGLMGTYYRKDTGKWQAKIKTYGRQHNLGCFGTAEEAHQAYQSAKRLLHTHLPNKDV